MRRRVGAALIVLGWRIIRAGHWVRERGVDLHGRPSIDALRTSLRDAGWTVLPSHDGEVN